MKWIKIGIIALILRLILGAFLYHTDLKSVYNSSSFISQGVTQAYILGLRDGNQPLNYPPAIFLIYYYHQKLDKFLFSPYFTTWMQDWSRFHVLKHPRIFQDLLVMKLPILIFDLIAALLIFKISPINKKNTALLLWLFNPFSLYAIYAFGQFDIIPTAFLLASFYCLENKKSFLSYVFLGAAAGVKVFPLLLLPFWVIWDKGSVQQKVLRSISALIVFVILLGPILKSPEALKSIFLSNLTGGLLQSTINLGHSQTLPIYLSLYLIFLFGGLLTKLRERIPLEAVIFFVFGFLFALSDFHAQWMVWIMPFLIISLVRNVLSWPLALGFMISYMGVVLSVDDKFLSFGLFKALNESFESLQSVRWYLDKLGIGGQFQGFWRASFFTLLVWEFLEVLGFVKRKWTFSFENISLWKIALGWTVTLVLLFVAIHVPLALLGVYVDQEAQVGDGRIVLLGDRVVNQKFQINNNNFSSFDIRIKNVNLKDKNDLDIDLNEVGGEDQKFKINGGAIGDDYDLKIHFPKIQNSANREFILSLSSPQSTQDSYFVIPYDKSAQNAGLEIDNKPVDGRLIFSLYYGPESLFANLSTTLKNIGSKL